MRDITSDLVERINELEAEQQRLTDELREIEKDKSLVKMLLEREIARKRRLQPALFGPGELGEGKEEKYSTPLARSVLEFLKERESAHLDDLKQNALLRGIDFADKSPGRAIHFLLLGMEQNGYVEKVQDGIWKLKR